MVQGKATNTPAIVIVGAGMAGLTAGLLLARKGRRCLIVEKEDAVGGLCRSLTMDGIVFDLGPHVFVPNPDFAADRFLLELLRGEPVIKRMLRFCIDTGERSWRLPVSFSDLLFSSVEYKRHLVSSFLLRRGGDREPGNVEQDIAAKFGPSYYGKVFGPMLLKKTLSRGSELHRDWIDRVDRDVEHRKEPPPRIPPAQLPSIIVRALYRSLFGSYHYPLGGFGRIPEKIATDFRAAGGEIIVGCGPLTLNGSAGRIDSIMVGGTRHAVEDLVWTGSVNALNRALGSDVPPLPYVKTVVALLSYAQRKRVRRPCLYTYYTDPELLFTRAYFPSSIYGGRTPPGREGVCLEINYLEDLDRLPDEEILRRSAADLGKTGLFQPQDLRETRLVRLGECMPVYAPDYERAMAEVFKPVQAFENVHSVGRLGGYFFCLTPSAVSQGIKIASHLG